MVCVHNVDVMLSNVSSNVAAQQTVSNAPITNIYWKLPKSVDEVRKPWQRWGMSGMSFP